MAAIAASWFILLLTAQTREVRYGQNVIQQEKHRSLDWPVYRGDPKGNQFAALAQVSATNVHKPTENHNLETQGRCARHRQRRPHLVIRSGRTQQRVVIRPRNRGVTYWKREQGERIFHFVRDRVYALEAKSGKLFPSFGSNGSSDLRENLGVDPAGVILEMTSPGAVYKNLPANGSGAIKPSGTTSEITTTRPPRSW